MDISQVVTYEQALDFIGQNPSLSEAQLRQLVLQMSVNVEGATSTLLYSGTVTASAEGIPTFKIANAIGDVNSTVAVIGKTDASRLLDSDEFLLALRQSVGATQADIILSGTSAPDGTRLTPGLFDEVSSRFVSEAVGPVDLPPITSPIWSRVLPGYRRATAARQS